MVTGTKLKFPQVLSQAMSMINSQSKQAQLQFVNIRQHMTSGVCRTNG